MAEDWDQGDGADWYMEDGFSGGGEDGEPTDSLEVFGLGNQPTDSLEVFGSGNQPTDSLEVFGSRTEPVSLGNVLSKPSTLNVSLPRKSQNKMMRSIVEIFELEEDPSNRDVELGEDDDEESVMDLEDQLRRTERLRGVLPTLAQLWWSDSDQIDLVAEKLGDGSRDRKHFRKIVHHSSTHAETFPVSSAGQGCKTHSKSSPCSALVFILIFLCKY
jgi:hypothetical protein